MTTHKLVQSTLFTASLAALTLLSGCVIHIGQESLDAEITLEEERTLSINKIDAFDIDAGAGFLKVYGKDNLNEIKASAEIITTEELDYTFTLVKHGNTAKLIAKNNTSTGLSWGKSPRINVTVQVPKALLVNIEDGSGDIIVADFNNGLSLDDSSGSIIVRNIIGNVDIEDRSGDIEIIAVEGSLRVDDSSGDIDIKGTKGNVIIDDSSGGLYIDETLGNINIEDNSGDIEIFDTKGMIRIDDGSGDINVEGAYSLNIIDDGSGSTFIKNVTKLTNNNNNNNK